MAILLRWWRSLLDLLSLHRDESARWVEPANDITRAVLSGQTLWLPALLETVSAAAAEPAVPEVTAPTLPEVAPEVEVAAAEERRPMPATRTRRRRGHRAA